MAKEEVGRGLLYEEKFNFGRLTYDGIEDETIAGILYIKIVIQ